MKTSSAKAKGRALQQQIVKSLRQYYKLDNNIESCYEGDVQSVVMGMSAEDIKLSPLGQSLIPFNIECKAQESLNIWSAIKQAEQNSKDRVPLLVFKRNRTTTYCTLKFNDLLKLLTQNE